MSAGKCPICGKPPEVKYRPFCSKRCADVDLQKWLTGRYAAPATDDESLAEDESGKARRGLFEDDE